LNNVGIFLAAGGQMKDAEKVLEDARAIQQKLVDGNPDAPGYRWHLAETYNNLGKVWWSRKTPQKAEEGFRQALALLKKLSADFPNVSHYQEELGVVHKNLGRVLEKTGHDAAEVEKSYREALALSRQLSTAFPNIPEYRHRLARVCLDLA